MDFIDRCNSFSLWKLLLKVDFQNFSLIHIVELSIRQLRFQMLILNLVYQNQRDIVINSD